MTEQQNIMQWKYFKDKCENIWARRTSTGSYGLIKQGWFENEFSIFPTPTVPKELTPISEEEAKRLLEESKNIPVVMKD